MRVWVLAAALLVASAGAFCPSGCECDESGFSVRCLGVGITMVPILLNPGLKQLKLSYNLISSIKEAFAFYEWLEELDLSHNGVSSLENGNFEQQNFLRELRLGHNNISSILPHSFKGLSSLHVLDLTHNSLVEIPPVFLQDSVKLKVLLLANNHILSVTTKAFRGLASLRILDLCSNFLRRVPGAALESVSATLETLQMCRNRLIGIEPDDFPTFNLKSLSLESNSITFIDPLAFVLLEKLQKLNINNNLLSDIPTRSFASLHSLTSLHLSRNNISVIRDRAFQGLMRLSFLEVSRCPDLKYVSPLSLSHCTNLHTLKLSYNMQLQHLPAEVLSLLPRLHSLEMRANGFQTIQESSIPWGPLESLDLRDNPFVCNCSLRWLLKALQQRNSSLTVTDILCNAPENLHGLYLST
ncbi:UNVERIFIED_CONTAM: hypothetical protein GTU68_043409 [Idotea baltica]|nr:hypothetical protein [Idotea baltica]